MSKGKSTSDMSLSKTNYINKGAGGKGEFCSVILLLISLIIARVSVCSKKGCQVLWKVFTGQILILLGKSSVQYFPKP